MWSPEGYPDRAPAVYYPGNPLSNMVFMKNTRGCHFEIVCDASTYDEHQFKDVTDEAFEELKVLFPEHNWGDE